MHEDSATAFRFLDDEQLLRRYRTHRYHDSSLQQLAAELRRRGLALPARVPLAGSAPDPRAENEFVTIATLLVPIDAHILCGCLRAAGVPAAVADAHLNQTDSLLTPALGGVRILVPAQLRVQAQQVIDAYNRGEYQLEDDSDVGSA